MQRFCIPLKVRPKRVRHGAPLAALPKSMYDTNDEIALGIRFVAKRALFGQCFAGVLPDCYYAMGSTGGVMIGATTVADLLPSVLIDRCFGRLQANCKNDLLGLFAAYITDDGMWFPSARPARQNVLASTATMEAIAECYERDFDKFLDTPKY